MTLTSEEATELERLEIAFEEAGGRGVELADRIDELRHKRDTIQRRVTLTFLLEFPQGDDPKVDRRYLAESFHEGLPEEYFEPEDPDEWRIAAIEWTT